VRPDPDAPDVAAAFLAALGRADARAQPYRHWLFADALPEPTRAELASLPIAPALIGDTRGKRDTHNAARVYYDAERRARHPACAAFAEAMQSKDVIDALQHACKVSLGGTNLRIEHCQDTAGFWLEPHTDIGVKKFTMLIYLEDQPGSADWGTDIYDGPDRPVGRAPYRQNAGLIFVPAADTWHGFAPRRIDGVRKSVIVNFVGPEWRARQELAFPETPIPWT
jgi:hypothetical protein